LLINGRGAVALETARVELAQWSDVIAIPGSVADAQHRRDLAQAAHELGGLDAVVNNAGILGPSPQPALLDYDLETLAGVFRINTMAPLGVLQAVAPSLKPKARIVTISSDAAVEAYEGWGGYGASKAALEQLTAVFAAENPQWRVYTVDPGDMQTEMHKAAFPGEDISDRGLPEESVPGIVALLTEDGWANGRYEARKIKTAVTAL
jgi:NAD(P)-dependent dehydrogenase (short-subunit alcohol dehydrogenase family)